MASVIGGLVVFALFFFPTIVAFRRDHASKWAIFAVNLLLGFTGIGWVVALVWAFYSPKAQPAVPEGCATEPTAHGRLDGGAPLRQAPDRDGMHAQYAARDRQTAEGEHLDGELARAVGANGVLVAFRDKVAIHRLRNVTTALLHGMKGDKEIRLSKVSSLQFRRPSGITRGYIQIEVMGGTTSQEGIRAATKDENTVLFDLPQLPAFLLVKATIEEALEALERPTPEAARRSPQTPAQELKEWKELLDAGAINAEEYESRKAALLGER